MCTEHLHNASICYQLFLEIITLSCTPFLFLYSFLFFFVIYHISFSLASFPLLSVCSFFLMSSLFSSLSLNFMLMTSKSLSRSQKEISYSYDYWLCFYSYLGSLNTSLPPFLSSVLCVLKLLYHLFTFFPSLFLSL